MAAIGCSSMRLPTTRSTCSIRPASSRAGIRARSGSRATTQPEIIGQHFSRFYTEEDRAAGLPRTGAEDGGAQRAASSTRAGASARTARASGPMSSSTRSATPVGEPHRLRQGHARLDRAQGGRGDAAAKRGAVPPAGPGRHRLRHLHARSRRTRDQLERGRRAHQGLPAPTRSSASTSRASIPKRIGPPDCRSTRSRLPRARDASSRKAGASARTAPVSGRMSSSTPIRDDDGAIDRLRQGHARHDRAAGSAAAPSSRRGRLCSSRRRWRRSAS